MESEKGVAYEPTKPISTATKLRNSSKQCFFSIGTLVIVVIITFIIAMVLLMPENEDKMPKSAFKDDFLFDFTTMSDVNDWYEVSDTVLEGGKSKATLVLQKNRKFQRAIFFTLLNPQPNANCFAGIYYDRSFDFGD